MVFVYHIHHSGLPTYDVLGGGLPYAALDACKFGVELFFGISGIVIVSSLAKGHSVWSFVVNRTTRIFPALWLSIIAMTVIAAFSDRYIPGPLEYALNFLSPPPFISVFLMNPAAWSLQYELAFYLVAVAVWRVNRSDRKLALLIAIAAASLLVLYPRGMLLLGGVGIGLGFGRDKLTAFFSKRPALMLAAFLAIWHLIEIHFGGANSSSGGDMMKVTPAVLPFSAWAAAFGAILLAGYIGTAALAGINSGVGMLSRLLDSRPMQWLGLVSYSFYIWHPVVMGIVKAGLLRAGIFVFMGKSSQLMFLCVALPPSILVAALSQSLIEARLTNLLRKRLDLSIPVEHAPKIPV
jgi:peptidoglycan/LPS O-acetylase OafA/YrhL